MQIVDLLAILPFYLSFLLPIDLRILRILRIFRFLKLARYSPALQSLGRAIANERRALVGALLVMIFGLGMFALPIAIVASGFSREANRREFVVTWSMVALCRSLLISMPPTSRASWVCFMPVSANPIRALSA